MRVVLYSRTDCHLCQQALAVLERLRLSEPFTLEVRDIDEDPDLLKRYDWRVPVVSIDGREVAEGTLDESALERLEGALRNSG